MSTDLRSVRELVSIVTEKSQKRYGADFPLRELEELLPQLLVDITEEGEERFQSEDAAEKPSAVFTPTYDINIRGEWFYNVSDSWLEIIVCAAPLLVVTGGAGAAALAALPLLIPLIKNLKRIPRSSLEYRVYQAIADYVTTHRQGPTLSDVEGVLSDVDTQVLQTALNQLVFEYRVIHLDNGKYVPGI